MKHYTLFIGAIFFLSFQNSKAALGGSFKKYCMMKRIDHIKRLRSPENRLSFWAGLGHLNIGTCWWYSRFLRNSAYLTYFSIEESKPSYWGAIQIIHSIMEGNSVVKIPGYSTIQDFSSDYKEEIRAVIANKQTERDEMISGVFVNLSAYFEGDQEELRLAMESIFHQLRYERVVPYVMMKMEGFNTHSMLVTKIEKIDGGYKVYYLDPNELEEKTLLYRNGMSKLRSHDGKDFFPHLLRGQEAVNLLVLKSIYCLPVTGKF